MLKELIEYIREGQTGSDIDNYLRFQIYSPN